MFCLAGVLAEIVKESLQDGRLDPAAAVEIAREEILVQHGRHATKDHEFSKQ